MQKFFENAFSGIGIADAIDILIVAFVIYQLLKLMKQTRAEQLLKGVIFLVVATVITGLLNLHTINWILKGAVSLGAVAIIVVFQPELRRGLEYMGRSKIVKAPISQMDKEKGKKITAHIVRAIETFSRDRVGALIVFERETNLTDITESGTVLDAEMSEQILGNIFYEGAPLHDGCRYHKGRQSVCGRLRAASVQHHGNKQESGDKAQSRHRHNGALRCAGAHSIGRDGNNFHGQRRPAFQIP